MGEDGGRAREKADRINSNKKDGRSSLMRLTNINSALLKYFENALEK